MESVREMIERRAFELFMRRGGQHGYHIQDWVQAEKDIMAQLDSKPSSQAAMTPKASVASPASAAPKAASTTKKRPAKKKVA